MEGVREGASTEVGGNAWARVLVPFYSPSIRQARTPLVPASTPRNRGGGPAGVAAAATARGGRGAKGDARASQSARGWAGRGAGRVEGAMGDMGASVWRWPLSHALRVQSRRMAAGGSAFRARAKLWAKGLCESGEEVVRFWFLFQPASGERVRNRFRPSTRPPARI